MSSRRGNFILLIFVILTLFAAGEIFLRLRYPLQVPPPRPKGWAIIPEQSWIEYHPKLGWFHQRNKSAALQKNQLQIPLTLNSIGLRGPREYFKPKPAGKTRIYVVGDSFTFGFGVRDEEVFTHVMEIRDENFEVMNLGIAGYGVDQMEILLQEFGFSYQPDMVLLAVYPEDFWRATRAFNDAGYGKPYYKMDRVGRLQLMQVPVPREKNFEAPQFPVFLQPSPLDKTLGWSRWYSLGKKAWVFAKKKMGQEDPDSSPEWRLGRAILEKAVNEIRSHQARPVLVIVPPRRWLAGTLEPVRDSMLRLAARLKVDIVDLTPAFSKAISSSTVDRYYIPDDFHWTAEGHKLAAETLLKYFREHPQASS